jgi:mRNA degradation ribonuclease J1/J2
VQTTQGWIENTGALRLHGSGQDDTRRRMEQQSDLHRLRKWLEHLDTLFVGAPVGGDEGLHSSGHASRPDLLEIVRSVSPTILITVYTEKPHYSVTALRGKGVEVRVPELGAEMALAT